MECKQFVAVSESDLTSLDDAKDSKSTKRTVSRSVKLFQQYLGEENAAFEQMPKYILNNHICMLYASIRSTKGDELKKSCAVGFVLYVLCYSIP